MIINKLKAINLFIIILGIIILGIILLIKGLIGLFTVLKNEQVHFLPVLEDVTKVKSVDLGETFRNSTDIPKFPVVTPETKSRIVKKLSLPQDRSILLLGPISNNAVQAANLVTQMSSENSTKPIYIVITSPGGSVLAGATLLSAIQASQAPVYTVCNVICASMAAIIHQYGHRRMQIDRSLLMFHPASGGAQGEVDKMYSMIGSIKRLIDKMNFEIAKKANLTSSQFKEMWSDELWIDAEDATMMKFNDLIVSLNVKEGFKEVLVSNQVDIKAFNYIMPRYEEYKHLFTAP